MESFRKWSEDRSLSQLEIYKSMNFSLVIITMPLSQLEIYKSMNFLLVIITVPFILMLTNL